ncbi:MAG: hypothetical protein AB7O67_05220 [Vicinamibacterales bacterium]
MVEKSCLGLVIIILLAGAWPAAAQDAPLQDVLTDLVTRRTVSVGDFPRDPTAAETTARTLVSTVLQAVATLPVPLPSQGLLYRFNPRLGVPERDSRTFGPMLLARPLTARAGHGSWAVDERYVEFASLNGGDLRSGTFVSAAHRVTGAPQAFDEERLTLRLSMRTTTVVAGYGLADRLEVGAALPIVTVNVEGQRLNFNGGVGVLQTTADAGDTGLGDLQLRVKNHFVGEGDNGLAADVQVRLPTGSEENLRGAGQASARVGLVAGRTVGAATVYGNVAHARGGLADETQAGGGIVAVVTPRLTASAELLARHFHGLRRAVPVAALHPSLPGIETNRIERAGDPLRLYQVSTGVKWSVAGTWLLTGQLLWTVNDAGLRAVVAPSVALEYLF